jgi:hypothetical protein
MIMIIFGNLASEIETVIVWCKAAKFDMRVRHLRRTERTQQTLALRGICLASSPKVNTEQN